MEKHPAFEAPNYFVWCLYLLLLTAGDAAADVDDDDDGDDGTVFAAYNDGGGDGFLYMLLHTNNDVDFVIPLYVILVVIVN